MKKLLALLFLGCAHHQTPIEDLEQNEVYVCRVNPDNRDELECMTLEEFVARVKAAHRGEM